MSPYSRLFLYFSEYSIPDTNDMMEENLNESQDQMKTLMQLQVSTCTMLLI